MTLPPPQPMLPSPAAAATTLPPQVTTPPPPVTTLPPPVTTQSSEVLYISVGVSGVVVVLIAAAVIVISVTVYLRKKKSKHINIFTNNVAYGVHENEVEMSTNVAYNVPCDSTRLQEKADTYYDYIGTTADVSIPTVPNLAHMHTCPVMFLCLSTRPMEW